MKSAGPGSEVNKIDLLGIPVSNRSFNPRSDLDSIEPGQSLIVTFVNPHACAMAEMHDTYVDMLRQFDWVLCDGIGMVMAARWRAKLCLDRAAFDLTSLAGPVCAWFAEDETAVVLIGGKPGISEKAAGLLRQLVPHLNIIRTFSGYDDDPSNAQKFMADNPGAAIICGMGAPRQEQFLLDLRESGWNGMGFTCGGFFDQLVDRIDYYPAWIDRMNLRFLYRLLKEPRRLWRRYLLEYQVFLKRLIKPGHSS